MLLLLLFSTLVLSVLANVEKTIFVAPPPNVSHPSHSFEFLDTLSPSTPSVSKSLNASFPSEEAPQGVSSWFRLVNLSPGQRYEVRICWLATQPTSFRLRTYTLSEILNSASLSTSLVTSSAPYSDNVASAKGQSLLPDKLSLFLVIDAAADYFTLNYTLMNDVPPVVADVILDPFFLNVFPQSLLPTALYVAVTAIIGWYICGIVQSQIKGIADSLSAMEKKKSH